ncbi:MAG: MFS transporter [Armatimonadetes bacterium]|nr:MFS transporter [Armatimonadota bacterium]MBX3107892.1 MFS transporter [Fimbriimonadaceae bacterium]
MKKPIVAIFLTIFLDMLSFGTVIPDIQLRAETLVKQASWLPQGNGAVLGLVIGFSIALFSLAQFLVAPYLGRLSDERGRRPVLLATCTLAVIGPLLYAFSGASLVVLWLARVIHGMAGGNLGVAYAYVADVTDEKDRASSMGLLGAAFGLGFIFGPPLGSWLIQLNGGQPVYLGLVSAFFALTNLAFVYFLLPESRAKGSALPAENRFKAMAQAFREPTLGLLLGLFFVASFAFTHLETTYYRLAHDVYLFDRMQTSMVLVTVGIVAAVVQGGLIRVVEPVVGERNLLRFGYILQAPILASMPFVMPWIPVIVGAILLGTGSGLAQPSLSSLVSKAAPEAMRGGIFGVNQSLGSLARIIGPFSANVAYAKSPAAPYLLAAAIMLIPTLGFLTFKFQTPGEAVS